MRPIRDRSSTITWQECCPTSKPKSSGAPIRPKDSSYCPGAGSLNAPSPGSTAVEDLPRTGRTSIARASHSCALPQSASCCENSVIPLDVLGQTLRVAQGGHWVPDDKVRDRWLRTMTLLQQAVRSSDRAYIFDNSLVGS